MTLLMYEYPPCGTCRKAKKYMEGKGIPFKTRHIVENPPSRKELERLVEQSGLPVQKFFNTSGKKYRERNLKEKLKEMSDKEKLELLASDGMLIKRPIVTDGSKAMVGFREQTFDEVWG